MAYKRIIDMHKIKDGMLLLISSNHFNRFDIFKVTKVSQCVIAHKTETLAYCYDINHNPYGDVYSIHEHALVLIPHFEIKKRSLLGILFYE